MIYSYRSAILPVPFIGEMAIPFIQVKKDAAGAQCHKDKKLRDHLDEKSIDKMIMDSFPASDPPSTY